MQSLNANGDETTIYSAYGKKIKVRLFFTGAGRTKQSFKAECDINQILARYLKTGVLEHAEKHEARYGDVTGIEYQSAMQLVAGAKTMFNELPAHVRDRFDNEPALFLDFVQDPANQEEAGKLGLLKPAKPSSAPEGEGRAAERPLPPYVFNRLAAGGEGGVSPPEGTSTTAPKTNTAT